MLHAQAKFLGSHHYESIYTDLTTNVRWNDQIYKADQLTWQVPISGRVFGTLFNFQGEYDALKNAMNQPPYEAPPKHPVLYIQPSNTRNSHLQPVPLPMNEDSFEVGAGLGVVIGKTATKLTKENAMEYIAGYTVVADYSIPHTSFYRPDIKNKVRDRSCVIGPWIIHKNDVTNHNNLSIKVSVNDVAKQENNTKNLIRSVTKLLAEITEFMTLAKGDLLLVGTPEDKPIVKNGDTVTVTIDQVGRLENSVTLNHEGGEAQ